jgi:glycine/D-amino acid oxidase-like deaminating enzyme
VAELRDADITVVGGGAIGCAVTYLLTRSGHRDVQLIEARELAGATSSQAAGLVGQVRASAERTLLAMASVKLFSRFEAETGRPVDWRQTGSIRIASTDERAAEFRMMADVATSVGLEVEFLSPARLAELFPPIDPGRVRAALWCPTDGYLQPNSLATAYAGAARELGASVVTNTRVLGVRTENGAVTGLETDRGSVRTRLVINAAGPWAWQVARMVGLDLPIVPVRHEYYVTEPAAGWHADLPVLRIPDERIYARAEVSGILCGGWEADAVSLDPRESTYAVATNPVPDWDVLAGFAEGLETVIPDATDAGIRQTFRGWPTFTPDGRFVIGPVPGIRGFVMAAGCNAHGVSGSAGIAEHVLDSLGPQPSPYVQSLSPARFMNGGWSWATARTAAQRVYEEYYSGIGSAAQGGAASGGAAQGGAAGMVGAASTNP